MRCDLLNLSPPSEPSHFDIMSCQSHQCKVLCILISGKYWRPWMNNPEFLHVQNSWGCSKAFQRAVLAADINNPCHSLAEVCDLLRFCSAGGTWRKTLHRKNCIMRGRGGGEKKFCIIKPRENNQLIWVRGRVWVWAKLQPVVHWEVVSPLRKVIPHFF